MPLPLSAGMSRRPQTHAEHLSTIVVFRRVGRLSVEGEHGRSAWASALACCSRVHEGLQVTALVPGAVPVRFELLRGDLHPGQVGIEEVRHGWVEGPVLGAALDGGAAFGELHLP